MFNCDIPINQVALTPQLADEISVIRSIIETSNFLFSGSEEELGIAIQLTLIAQKKITDIDMVINKDNSQQKHRDNQNAYR